VSRLKSAVARSRRIKRRKERLRDDRSAHRFGDDVWRCIVSHSSKGHGLRLRVDDDGQVLECVGCGFPAVMGSDEVMEAVIGLMKTCGIEFEVLCETEMV
jgi:hypothetical protein